MSSSAAATFNPTFKLTIHITPNTTATYNTADIPQPPDEQLSDENRSAQAARRSAKQQRAAAYFDAQVESAFPTEGREGQKVAEKAHKAAGIAARTRPKPVEEHFDDCGIDVSGLGTDLELLAASYIIEADEADSSDNEIASRS